MNALIKAFTMRKIEEYTLCVDLGRRSYVKFNMYDRRRME